MGWLVLNDIRVHEALHGYRVYQEGPADLLLCHRVHITLSDRKDLVFSHLVPTCLPCLRSHLVYPLPPGTMSRVPLRRAVATIRAAGAVGVAVYSVECVVLIPFLFPRLSGRFFVS